MDTWLLTALAVAAAVAIILFRVRASKPRLGSNDPPTQREREDAKRFARLLVNEIKLYNAEKVGEVSLDGSTDARLRKDINRARELFEKRVRPVVFAEEDYFRDALVEVLCEGDATLLEEYGIHPDSERVH